MLATAVALNLEGAPTKTVEEAAKDPMVEAVLGGMNPAPHPLVGLRRDACQLQRRALRLLARLRDG